MADWWASVAAQPQPVPIGWILQLGALDLIRSLLIVGLFYLVLEVRFPGTSIRPVRSFLEWGQNSPFLLFTLVALTLVVWGVVGRDYGLQEAFFHDDPWVQLALGAGVSLLILGVIYQYYAVTDSGAGWRDVARLTCDVGLFLSRLPGLKRRAVFGVMPNGLLDRLTEDDLEALRVGLIRAEGTEPPGEDAAGVARVRDLVESRSFRILFAPAVLMVNSLAFLVMLGLVPYFVHSPAPGPWALGVLVGTGLALGAATLSSRWIVAAMGGPGEIDERLERFRGHRPEGPAREPRDERSGRFLFAAVASFYAIHAAIYVAWSSLKSHPEWATPPSGERLGANLAWVLAFEIGLAAAIAGAMLVHRERLAAWMTSRPARLAQAVVAAIVTVAAVSVRWWRAPWRATTSAEGRWTALGLMAAYLLVWCVGFWSATRWRRKWPWLLDRDEPFSVRGLLLLGVLTLVAWQAPWYVAIPAVAAAAIPVLATVARSRTPGLLYPASALLAYGLFARWYNGLPEGSRAHLPSGFAMLALFSVLASVYALVRFGSARRLPFAGVAAILVVFLCNGNAWEADPNQFKLRFPGLNAYYGDRGLVDDAPAQEPSAPVRLNSRAYFRSTTPTVVKLKDKRITDEEDRQSGLVQTERPGTMNFVLKMAPDERDDHGRAGALYLELYDVRGRVRLAPGDRVELVLAEESLEEDRAASAPGSWGLRLVGSSPSALTGQAPKGPETTELVGRDAIQIASYGRSDSLRVRIEEPGRAAAGEGSREVDLQKILQVRRSTGEPGRGFEVRASQGRPTPTTLVIHGQEGRRPARALVARRIEAEVVERKEDEGRKLIDVLPADKKVASHPGRPAAVVRIGDAHGLTDLVRAVGPHPRDGVEARALDARKRALVGLFEEAHLVVGEGEQPSSAVDRAAKGLGLRPGDCVVLERQLVRMESSPDRQRVGLGTFVYRPPADRAGGAVPGDLQLDQATIDEHLRRYRDRNGDGSAFEPTVRRAIDRGIFARAGGAGEGRSRLLLFRGDRLRLGDRLFLCQRGRDGAEECRVAEVLELRADDLPEGCPTARWATLAGAPARGGAGEWRVLGPLDNLDVLESWRDRLMSRRPRPGEGRVGRPPLVIVTVSGGGIRASVWTATVLQGLKRALGPDFPYHVRLITGASGGMVSAAEFAAALPPPDDRNLPIGGTSRLDRALDRDLGRNQLNSVAGCLVFTDLPGLLNPMWRRADRGVTLEETWIRLTGEDASPLARPMHEYAADERAGRRPSLAFTPMMVEDGRRLLISNLDLSFVSRNYGRIMTEREDSRLDPEYSQALMPDVPHRESDLFSLSAIEFTRIFPRAWNFRLATAARMSASFPWVSPTVSLPTTPPRRVVDAGYYDNYGVNLAAQWVTKLRYWLVENTSGVLIVQIRDSVSQKVRTEIGAENDAPREEGPIGRLTWGAIPSVLSPGFHPLNTPLVGVAAARQWSMSFRNDEQVELLDRLLRDLTPAEKDDGFFHTIVFECPVAASTSWTLGAGEERNIRHAFPSEERRVRRLAEIERLAYLHDHGRRADGGELLSQADHEARAKRLYDGELERAGYGRGDDRTFEESRDLYSNLWNTRRRVALLTAWWRARVPQP